MNRICFLFFYITEKKPKYHETLALGSFAGSVIPLSELSEAIALLINGTFFYTWLSVLCQHPTNAPRAVLLLLKIFITVFASIKKTVSLP